MMEGQRIDRAEMKAQARSAMRGRKPSVLLVALLFFLIVALLQGLSMRLQYPNLDPAKLEQWLMEENIEAIQAALSEKISFTAELLNTAVVLMEIMISMGFSCYSLRVVRGDQEAGFGDLLDPFGYFYKVILLHLLRACLILLWALLFVIPGVVAFYRYSLAEFILIDDPDKPLLECLRESKELTRGHKGELFVLDLSFFGWILLSAIPFVSCYTSPYIRMTHANYYRALSGRQDAPVHVDILA